MTHVDPAALPRVAPSAIGEARYQADRARRFPTRDGIPDPRATWRPTQDPTVLRALMQRVLTDELAAAAPPETRRAVAQLLLDDIDARFPLSDMAVLARYGLTSTYSTVHVDFERLTLPGARELPAPAIRLYPVQFTMVPVDACDRAARVPDAARPMFEAIAAVRARDVTNLPTAEVWPVRFHHEHKRRPTWAEIEAGLPRLGAWLAQQRSEA